MKFDAYFDPGHGWVKVSKKLIEKLGIGGKVSSYSYERGEYAYLEEDCDAGLLKTAVEGLGKKFEIRYHSTDKRSKIRSYRPFGCTAKCSYPGDFNFYN